MKVIRGRGIEVLALTRCPVCRRLESDIKEVSGEYVFTYMDEWMTPAQVDALKAHVANQYGHHTVPIVFNNRSFNGSSEAVYEMLRRSSLLQ